jgi:hypothetical protein
MHSLGWFRFRAAEASFAHKDLRNIRQIWSKIWLERRPNPEDWKNIGWSDEFHFPITGTAKRKRITRQIGERYNQECIQKVSRTSKIRKKQQKELGELPAQIHCWVFLHWEGREIVFYEVGNKEGKMNAKCYIEQCLTHILPVLKEKGL